MTQDEYKFITGLFSSQIAAMTAVCNVLAAKGVVTKDEIAEALLASAATTNDPMRGLASRTLGAAVRDSTTPEAAQAMRELLAQVQRGQSRPPQPPAAG